MTLSKLAFSGFGLDRAAHLRDDPKALADLLQGGRILPLWRGKPLVHLKQDLAWLQADHSFLALATDGPYFLAIDGGIGYFVADISEWEPLLEPEVEKGFFDASAQTHPDLGPDFAFLELRGIMLTLSARDSELAAAARALLHWNSSTGFCAACGGVVISQKSGWQRSCAACSASHFPRTDPVVIMLVTRGNRALIGRSHPWPQGMYSCLAGFIEPGETLESAVAREVLEETGVAVKDVRYLASQPWPFPASLMFGCVATAVTENIIIDPVELEDARWISREDMVQVMAGSHPEIIPARRGAIAHYLISCWLAGEI